jgi:hypothetical protein
MGEAVSRRPSTAEIGFRFLASSCGICGGQSGTGTGFYQSTWFSPVNFIPSVFLYTEKRKN